MPEDALHKSAAASNENRVSKAPSQDSGRSTDGWVAGESDAPVSAQSSLKSESLTKTAFDGELLAGTTEVHSASTIAASNGTQAVSSRLPADPWSNGYKPAPLPEELEPARKIETPDMLRWRAEMLLDEMMVGAVDVSAGDAGSERAGWRAFAHNDASLPLDEHPRFEVKPVAQQSQGASETAVQVAGREESAPTSGASASVASVVSVASATVPAQGQIEAVIAVDKAAVRAALPPRSTSRMPTPIGRNGEQVAHGSVNGQAVNGQAGNGHSANGLTNGNGRHETPAAANSAFAEAEIDPLGDIADDGRPTAYQNGAGLHGAANGNGANGDAPRTPTRLEGAHETPAANGHVASPLPESRVSADPASAAETSAPEANTLDGSAADSTATGYALDSSATRAALRTTTASMVDPLEELDAWPPLPTTQTRGEPPAAPVYTSTYTPPAPAAPSAFVAASSTAPEAPRTPARTASPAESPYTPASTSYSASTGAEASVLPNMAAKTESAQSLAAQYSAYAPPPSATPVMPARVETASHESTPRESGAKESGARTQGKGKLTAVEQRYPRQIQPEAVARGAATPGMHNDGLPNDSIMQTSGLGPVRINPAVLNSASITGAMAVGSRASSRYASLLPRATPWDLHEMEREIVALQEEMARVMPQGHESTRRARHLLEKAQTIFVNDPLRSAEVDYYLTQVKAIVQHSHQTLEWSERYRRQLMRYHWAWIGFSTLMLTLCLLFGTQLQGWAVGLFGLNETGTLASNLVPAAIAVFAGSLGASIGALFTMRRYHKLALGYFDRKYSLRGLMLPVIGMLCGLVFYGVFSTLYWALGVRTPLPIGLEMVPTVLAFLLGFLQENLYGTRD